MRRISGLLGTKPNKLAQFREMSTFGVVDCLVFPMAAWIFSATIYENALELKMYDKCLCVSVHC